MQVDGYTGAAQEKAAPAGERNHSLTAVTYQQVQRKRFQSYKSYLEKEPRQGRKSHAGKACIRPGVVANEMGQQLIANKDIRRGLLHTWEALKKSACMGGRDCKFNACCDPNSGCTPSLHKTPAKELRK